MTLSDHLAIGWQLLRREYYVLIRSWRTDAIDTVVMSLSALFTFGYFMPGMGMPTSLCIPVYLGAMVTMTLFFGFTRAGMLSIDLSSSKLMHYHVALPIPVWISLGISVISMIAHMLFFVVPAGFFGVYMLQGCSALSIDFLSLCAVVLSGGSFLAVLFLWAIMHWTTERYYTHMWPRVLIWFFCFGCLFYPWQRISAYSDKVGTLLLCNPVVHLIEGVRAALLQDLTYLPVGPAVLYLTFMACLVGWRYVVAAQRRLDMVRWRK